MTHGKPSTATIRIAPRSDQAGVKLFLGKVLWQAIGEPARLDLAEEGGALALLPGQDYAVSGDNQDGQPRITLGIGQCAAFGIDATAPASYGAAVQLTPPRIVTDLPVRVVVAPDAAAIRAFRRRHGLSRRELARRLGVPLGTLRGWETGRKPPAKRIDLTAALASVAAHA